MVPVSVMARARYRFRHTFRERGRIRRVIIAAFVLVLAEVAVASYIGEAADFDPEAGLLLHESATPDGATLHYERPVVLLPVTMTIGELHTSQRRFVLRVDGDKRDVGAHYFEAELLGVEAWEDYEDCLKIRRHMLRMDYSGTEYGEDVIEWYARGIGLVKAEGERFWRDAEGNKTRTERIE